MKQLAQRMTAYTCLVMGGMLLGVFNLHPSFQVTPADDRMGWAGPGVVEDSEPLVAGVPNFELRDEAGNLVIQSNEKANVRLWDAVQKRNGGQHTRNYAQLIGDCVSFGFKNAMEYLQFQIIDDWFTKKEMGVAQPRGPPPKFQPVSTMYSYGYSRVQIGKGVLGNSDGSVGAWAAKAAEEGGVLPANAPGCPPYDKPTAKAWGLRGPPPEMVALAKQHLVKAVARVPDAQAAWDAIANRYPVTIASNFGTNTIRPQDGRMVARWDGSWAHQMCLVGIDGSSPSGKRYFYCLNSWGETAHPAPMQGEPPGGFWITFEDVDRICKSSKDSYAFSQFDHFKPADVDFRLVVGSSGPQTNGETAMLNQWIGPYLNSLDQTTGTCLALILVLVGLATLALMRKHQHGQLGNAVSGGNRRILTILFAIVAGNLFATSQGHAQTVDFRKPPTPSVSGDKPKPAVNFLQPNSTIAGTQLAQVQTPSTITDGTCLDSRPLLRIYGDPSTCAPCAKEETDLREYAKTNFLPFQVQFIKDPLWYPRIVEDHIAKSGRPVLYWQKGKQGFLVSGYRTPEQLIKDMEGANPPEPAFDRKVDFKPPPVAVK